MFGHLTGELFALSGTRAIIKVGGLGINVNITPNLNQKLKIGSLVNFWTHTAVRENSIEIYGFETETELHIFELLISVSGVGPKSGLAIIGIAGVNAIEEAVVNKDISGLTKISGIGKKTAEKIVLELNGKVFRSSKESTNLSENIEVYEALKSLGYRDREIQETLKSLPKDLIGTNEKIKHVLKNLGK